MVTVRSSHRLLVVVRTRTNLNRLLDILALTRDDTRIQTCFTWDAKRRSDLSGGAVASLQEIGAQYVSWKAARKTHFHLAVAASENDRLDRLRAPVLLVPHGAGHQKFRAGTSVISGLAPERLVVRGRLVPAAIALPHPTHLGRLREVCPEASAAGVVVGDPALARMRASVFRSGRLRDGFGVRGRRMVVVASTHGPDSVLGRLPELPLRLVAALPADEFQVAVILHPGVWAAHGSWQVRGWLHRAASHGVTIVAPDEGWQAALLAADVVISDHGSLALYATVLGKTVVLAGADSAVTVPGTAAAELAAGAPVWDPDADPRKQVDVPDDPALRERVAALLVEPEVDVAQRMRTLIYHLMGLGEPGYAASFDPVTVPAAGAASAIPAWVAGVRVRAAGVQVQRFPDLGIGEPHDGLDHRHLIADERTASLAQLGAAAVIVTDHRGAGSVGRWAERVRPGAWPLAMVLLSVTGPASCVVRTQDGLTLLSAQAPIDPTVLGSYVYGRLRAGGRIPARGMLLLGDRVIEVAAEAG